MACLARLERIRNDEGTKGDETEPNGTVGYPAARPVEHSRALHLPFEVNLEKEVAYMSAVIRLCLRPPPPSAPPPRPPRDSCGTRSKEGA